MKGKLYYAIRFRWQKYLFNRKERKNKQLIRQYVRDGQIPWSRGYNEYKESAISKALKSAEIIDQFQREKLPDGYGYRIDERVVEYPWIYSQLFNILNKPSTSKNKLKFLDAGSTFNFKYIIDAFELKRVDTTIFTFYPENNCYWKDKISYQFGDLRAIPYRNDYFDIVVCHSTIEHIDMDNSIYGYNTNSNTPLDKSFDFILAIKELNRVLRPGGKLLLTFPYGMYERHNFFQQFDHAMVDIIVKELVQFGLIKLSFFRYHENGWKVALQEECEDAQSYNPHTGVGKGLDNAAHSRAICCLSFNKTI